MCMIRPKPTKAPIWVKIIHIPFEAWNVEGISRIASMIGNPIIMDRITTAMCNRANGRANFARVLVEIDAQKGLVENIDVCYKSLGKFMQLKVEYPWKPPICNSCKVFGHETDKCGKTVIIDKEKAQNVDQKKESVSHEACMENKNDNWKSVDKRKVGNTGSNNAASFVSNGQRMYYGETSYGRGGYAGRGRGNMNGRGNNFQRNYRNTTQYFPAKNVSEVNRSNDEGKAKVDEGPNANHKTNDVSRSKTTEAPGKNQTKVNESKKNNGNRYAVLSNDLSNEQENEDVDEEQVIKSKIDEICGKGEFVSTSVRNKWTNDIKKYYSGKIQDSIKAMKDDGMQEQVQNLEKQISYSSGNIALGSKVKADSLVKATMIEKGLTENQVYANVYDEVYRDELERIKEMSTKKKQLEVKMFFKSKQMFTKLEFKTWDEEKLEMYQAVVGEIFYNDLIRQFGIDNVVTFEDEVAQINNGSANFITQDVVSNVTCDSIEQMQNDIASKSTLN